MRFLKFSICCFLKYPIAVTYLQFIEYYKTNISLITMNYIFSLSTGTAKYIRRSARQARLLRTWLSFVKVKDWTKIKQQKSQESGMAFPSLLK